MKKYPFLLITLMFLPIFLNAWADWQVISNKHFKIYYKAKWEEQAISALTSLENTRPYLESLTGNKISQTPFVIQDKGNEVNGYTDPFGKRIALFTYPPTNEELAICEDWYQMVSAHEYIHLLQMTRVGGIPKLLRMGFSNYLYPQIHQPYWMTEGITVYGESQLSPYTGRLNGGTYPSIIKALAKEDKLPSQTKASYYSFDTPHAHFYTFGGSFHNYLAKTYGEGNFAKLYDETSTSLSAYLNTVFPMFNLDKAYLRVYGKPLSILWQDWKAAEANSDYTKPNYNITKDGWYKADLSSDGKSYFYTAGKAVKTGPGSSFYSNRINSGDVSGLSKQDNQNQEALFKNKALQPEVLIEQATEFPAGYFVHNNILYYSRLELRKGFDNNENSGYGAVVELWQKDLTTSKKSFIYRGNVRAFYPLDKDRFVISEDNATHTQSAVFIYQPATRAKTELLQADGLVHAILPHGNNYILGIKYPWHNNSIYSFDPTSKKLTFVVVTPFYSTPVSVQDDILIFNAVFDNKVRGYQYNMYTGLCNLITDYSDVRTPVVLPDDSTLFISTNGSGFDVYKEKTTLTPYPLPDISMAPYKGLPAKSKSGQESGFEHHGKGRAFLSNLAHMAVPRLFHMPFIEGSGDSLHFGYILSGNDAVGDFPFWSASVGYDTYFDKVKYSLSLVNNFFSPISQEIGYSNDDEQTLSSYQSVSLYQRMNYGLRNVTTGFGFVTKDDYARKLWSPFLNLGFGWSTGRLSLSQYALYETQDFLPSDRERLGFQTYLQTKQKMPFTSEIRATVHTAFDPDADNDEVFARIRGYEDATLGNEGAIVKATWYKPIFQIREGLWNPQIYVEDINLGLFYDTALPLKDNSFNSQSSYGAEVLAELGLAYYINFNAGLRFSYNKDQESMVQFIIDTDF